MSGFLMPCARVLTILLGLVLTVSLAAQDAPPAAIAPATTRAAAGVPRKLPVRRVVLYKNGVGFFEHLGQVTGTERLSIDFTSAQLDDALKSLTILDLDGGRTGAVAYNSDAPLARRLGAINLPLEDGRSAAVLLGALRGARVEVNRAGVAASGRLIGVERRLTGGEGEKARERDELSIISDAGEVRVFELGPGTSVRLLERDLNDRVGRYLGLVASDRDRDLRRMTIDASGNGARRLYVSYVSEVPVWKTTYRLVLPSDAGATALLQGWAIVDNTVGEDWTDVDLSLVAGAPVSFIQQLSQPLYTSRPVVPLPSSLLLTPQMHAGTMATGSGRVSGRVVDASGSTLPGTTLRIVNEAGLQVWSGVSGDDGGFGAASIPAGSYQLSAELQGFQPSTTPLIVAPGGSATVNPVLQAGTLSEAVTVMAAPMAAPMAPPAPMPNRQGGGRSRSVPGGVVGGVVGGLPDAPPANYASAMAAQSASAMGQDLGDLFEYKLDRPVTIKQNQSALVPILQANIAADRVSLWSANGPAGERPLNAIWITNTSPYTLDGGSVTLLDRNTYAGEGLVEPIKPKEKRLLSYSLDLAMRIQSTPADYARRVSRVRAARGMVISETLSCATTTYTIRNEDTLARAAVIEHQQQAGWTLAPGGPEPVETSSSSYRFRVPVEAKKTAQLVVRLAHAEEVRYAVASLGADQVTALGRDMKLDAKTLDALRSISAKQAQVAEVDHDLSAKETERAKIGSDQERVRENMKALKGSAEEKRLLERYVQQLSGGEDRLAAIDRETADRQKTRDALQAELQAMIEALAFDAGTTGASACAGR